MTNQDQAHSRPQGGLSRLQAVLNAAIDGMITIDEQGVIESLDQAAVELFGYAAEEAVGQNIALFMPSPDREQHDDNLANYLRTGQAKMIGSGRKILAKHKDGRVFPIELAVNEARSKDKRLFTGFVHDVSSVRARLRQAELMVSQRETWLDYLLTVSPVIYCCKAFGSHGTTYISENVEALTGHRPSDFLVDPNFWFDHLHPDDKSHLPEKMSELANSGEQWTHEYRFRALDGSYIWLHDKMQIGRDSDGNPIEMMGCWLDITQRKQAEAMIRSANADLSKRSEELTQTNEELSQFTYAVSHDLKAPMRAIHSYSDWLAQDLDNTLDGDQKDYLDGLREAVCQAEALIEDLLELSRIGRRETPVETIPLTDFFKRLTKRMNFGADIEVEIAPDLPTLENSPVLLTQIFQNLILNAVTYNQSQPKRVEIGCRAKDTAHEISLRDNGIGINPEFHQRIFQIFQRLHTREEFEGTGVGLAIVKKAVQHLGGKVRIESELDHGSTFFVTLPHEVKLHGQLSDSSG